MRWAQLLKRVFDIDFEHCPHCGGQLKLIAAIEEPAVIQRILTHLGLAVWAAFNRLSCKRTDGGDKQALCVGILSAILRKRRGSSGWARVV